MNDDSVRIKIAALFRRARAGFGKTAELDFDKAAEAYDRVLLTGIAALAQQHGLATTMKALHAFHAEHREHLLESPIALEPFLEGQNSHWEWLDVKFSIDNPAIWEAILTDQEVDREAYEVWSQINILTLEQDITDIFVDTAAAKIVAQYPNPDPKLTLLNDLAETRTWLTANWFRKSSEREKPPALIDMIAATELRLADGISVTLPDWEVMVILDKGWMKLINALQHQ